MSGLTPERRHHLLEAVATWLDQLHEAEPAPSGLSPEIEAPAEREPDLFTLLSQLAALTRETQLQGRATNRLHAEIRDALEDLARNTLSPAAIAKTMTEARREARTDVVTELLEVRDRFNRGLIEAERRLKEQRGIRAWLGQRAVLEALVEGNTLARERFDDLLRRLDVREIACLGRRFDPTLMRAVEAVETSERPPGTVIEVFRAGYTCDGRVLRFAEVKVVAGCPDAPGEFADD